MNACASRFATVVALVACLTLIATLAACSSNEPAPAEGNSNSTAATNNDEVVTVPVNNGNGSGNGGASGVPSETAPREYDGAPAKAEDMYEGLVEVLQFRNLKTLAVPKVQVPTRREIYDATDVASGNDWIADSLASGHRDDYLKSKADSLSFAANKLVTNPPVFGKVIEEEFKEQLTQMIFASQTDAYDPETAAELGRYASADAVLFTRITASFKALRMVTMMSRGRYWVRGTYKFEARLVLTEEATRVWTNSVEWDKFFIVSQY